MERRVGIGLAPGRSHRQDEGAVGDGRELPFRGGRGGRCGGEGVRGGYEGALGREEREEREGEGEGEGEREGEGEGEGDGKVGTRHVMRHVNGHKTDFGNVV